MERSLPFVNAVYYPSWRVYKDIPPSSLPVARISTIFYAFAIPNEDGSLKFLDEYADAQIPVDGELGCLAALARLKSANPHLRTVLSIGGGSGSTAFPHFAATVNGRAAFAQCAKEWVDRYSFDGIDIDWEHPNSREQGSHYIQLMQACRAVLPAPRYLLATALPVDPGMLGFIDLRWLGGLVDHINLMCYDYTGPWSTTAGHHAQLFASGHGQLATCGQSGMQYLLGQGVHPRKILLGVPAYARCFPGAHALGHGFRKGEDGCEIDYRDVPDAWKKSAQVDPAIGAAWYIDGSKGFVSFDVPQTAFAKGAFARTSGLGGLFFWTGAGDEPGEGSLVVAGFNGLHAQ